MQIMPPGFHQPDEEHLGGLRYNLEKYAVILHREEDMKGKMILALILVRLNNEAAAAAAAAAVALGKMTSCTESLTL